MEIGDGATGTITQPWKQGGLVAIYYLGTLFGALLCEYPQLFPLGHGLTFDPGVALSQIRLGAEKRSSLAVSGASWVHP